MAEYIFTNLPQYIRITPRSDFSSSVVSSGAVLLFTEDGLTLTAKQSDGTFITIGGGSGGTDVSSTTADASDVLSPKVFFNSAGVMTTGTIQTVNSSSYTPGTSDQVISAGVYLGGSQTILGDANLVGSNIVSGVSIFGVSGTHQGGTDVSDTTATAATVLGGYEFYDSSGIKTSGTIPTVSASLSANVTTVPAGHIASAQTLTVPEASSATVAGGIVTIPQGYVPAAYTVSAGSGGNTDFYKCATITSGGSTWTGYLAVFSGGSFSYNSAVTSGLSYGLGFTPEVGYVYTDGALVKASLYEGFPVSGMVFYAPLSSAAANAETGQELSLTGSLTYETYKGVPSALFDGQSYITITDLVRINSCNTNNAISISFWMCGNGNYSYYDGIFTAQNGSAPTNWQWAAFYQGNGSTFNLILNGGSDVDYSIASDTWYHFCMVGGNGTWKFYVNGTQNATGTCNAIQSISNAVMIGRWNSTYGKYQGRLAGLRLYNRELTQSEVADLAAEFIPTA